VSEIQVGTEVEANRVAIIGMAARVPGAASIDQFWKNLVEGLESLTYITDEQMRNNGYSERRNSDPNLVRLAPLMDQMEYFDAKLFGYTARDAEIACPQHRLLLELCHTAIQHAGVDPSRYPGSIGVFGGSAPNNYDEQNLYSNKRIKSAVGNIAIEINTKLDYLATRVAYNLGLTGPAVTVETACSTSMVAIHMAYRSLLAGECQMALAGAVNISLPYYAGHVWTDGSMYSRDGHIRAFDASASGTNFGHGGGVVVLKRYADALADGDYIHAVILGSAINNDGARRSVFTAPSSAGQVEVVTQALSAANNLNPDTVSYVEAHGTGTIVGDPIEVNALTDAYRRAGGTGKQIVPIGSVKSNIGHLGPASGVAGLVKTVLALEHKQVPPSLHYEKPNPNIDFAETPFFVNQQLSPWSRTDSPRRAGVSSFGIGGTNAHLIVEESPPPPPTDSSKPWQIVPLSAKTPTALATMRTELDTHLRAKPELDPADVAYTLQVGRPALEHRTVAVGQDLDGALASLATADATEVSSRSSANVAFMFPGQGAQYIDMADEIYQTEPLFREIVDECATLLQPHLGCDLRDVLFSRRLDDPDLEALTERLRQTRLTQPALFVIEYALARLWISWGVEPTAMIGHSVGEYVAASLADVFTLADALEVVATRARLTQSMPPGDMLALPLSEDDLAPLLADDADISLAAVNAPQTTVVAGPAEAVQDLRDRLAAAGIRGQILNTSHAFHSAMLDPIVGQLHEVVAKASPQPPKREFVSTLTGTWITAEQATDPGYWADQLRSTVRFAAACQELGQRNAVLLEVGPGHTLTGLAKRCLPKGYPMVPSLIRPGSDRSEGEALATAVGSLWSRGIDIDWPAMHGSARRQRLPLPTYPYERERYWVDPDPGTEEEEEATPAQPTGILPAAEATFLPVWRQRPLTNAEQPPVTTGPWLIFSPGDGPVEAVADELAARGDRVVRVGVGDEFVDLGDHRYLISPGVRDDYHELLKALQADPGRPTAVLHGWTATAESATPLDRLTVNGVRETGFYSLLFLSQALMERWPDESMDIRVITTNSCNVSGAERVEPAKSLLFGPCRVIPIEAPLMKYQVIDLAGVTTTTATVSLLQEVRAPNADPLVAYRTNRRWVGDYEQRILPARVELPRSLRRRGVYLITGGLGGIGLEVAKELARTAGVRLVLVARSELPPRETWDEYLAEHGKADPVSMRILGVRAVEALGGEVMTAAADVIDEAAMRAVVEAARERFGRIDGVFHAAGVAAGGLAALRTREQAERVLQPKVEGTLVLDRLLGREIDLMVLFSSIISVAGYYGNVDYASGNAFMDAFAQARVGDRAYTLAINWCGWDEVGMVTKNESAAPEGFRQLEDGLRFSEARHPLLGRRALDTNEVIFSAFIHPTYHWVVTDHQMDGQAVFPGTLYAELIRAAFHEGVGEGPVELRDLFFTRPLAITGKRELRVSGRKRESGAYQFTVSSRSLEEAGAPWEQHASGTAKAAPDASDMPQHDVEAIVRRCDTLTWQPDLTDTTLVTFGARWQVVEQVWVGDGEQVVQLAMPAGLDDDIADFVLHPSLLDGATSLGLFLPDLLRDGSSFLPMAYDRLVVRGALPARFYSHIRHNPSGGQSDIKSFDIKIMDGDGRELVSIDSFSVRQVNPSAVLSSMESAPMERAQTGSGPTRGEQAGGKRSKEVRPGSDDEILVTPAEAIDLLWRMLDHRGESQFVVSPESLKARSRRVARMAKAILTAGAKPLTSPGKRDADRAAATAVAAAAATETEKQLMALWQDTFGISEIGLDEDFFELGGNSLVAVQLAVRVRETFGVNVPGVAVIEFPTVQTLARRIDELAAEEG
jgi:acyl transferase domain-containing protein